MLDRLIPEELFEFENFLNFIVFVVFGVVTGVFGDETVVVAAAVVPLFSD